MRDGIYQLIYSGATYKARGMFVFRKGTFVGLGQTGANYEGAYWWSAADQMLDFDGCVRFLAGTELVTSPGVHEKELTVPFKGRGRLENGNGSFVLDFAGQPVDVQMTFISPIPGRGDRRHGHQPTWSLGPAGLVACSTSVSNLTTSDPGATGSIMAGLLARRRPYTRADDPVEFANPIATTWPQWIR